MNSLSPKRVFCCDYRKKILQTNQRLRRNNPERCKADADFAAIPPKTSELAARQQTRLSTYSGFRHRQARTLPDRLVAASSRQVTDVTMTASRSLLLCAMRSAARPGLVKHSVYMPASAVSMHIYMPRTGCF